jgi:hypothetical protein
MGNLAGARRVLAGNPATRYNRGMNTVCLVIDRLHVGYLGAYGNTWIRTPALDRLAAEGFTFDDAFIESPQLEPLYEAYWLGRHAMGPPGLIDAACSLPALLSARGVTTRLLTDDKAVAGHRLAGSFQEIVQLDLKEPHAPAESVEDTLLGECFGQALEFLDTAKGSFSLWCHFRSMGTAWDAPREFRLANHDEGDPEPPDSVLVPGKMLPKDYDPDELLGYSQVYAAQVNVLDACIRVVHDWLQTSPIGRETLLVVTSARGFPMGEHLRVGDRDGALYGELVQIPLLVRFPDMFNASDRSRCLVQPSDLAPTLLEWHGVPSERIMAGESIIPIIRGEYDRVRQCAGILGLQGERALITPAWHLRQGKGPELFSRPDDRWCANDVANRCVDVVEALSRILSQYHQAMQSGHISDLPAMEPHLLVAPD